MSIGCMFSNMSWYTRFLICRLWDVVGLWISIIFNPSSNHSNWLVLRTVKGGQWVIHLVDIGQPLSKLGYRCACWKVDHGTVKDGCEKNSLQCPLCSTRLQCCSLQYDENGQL